MLKEEAKEVHFKTPNTFRAFAFALVGIFCIFVKVWELVKPVLLFGNVCLDFYI